MRSRTTDRWVRALVALTVSGCGTAENRSADPQLDSDVEPATPTREVDASVGAADPSAGATTDPLYLDSAVVRASDGTVLLTLDVMPEWIRVDEDAEFGATDRFTDASVSPDEAWLAVTTTGAAHSAGWLATTDGEEVWPAAFQYGGDLQIGPWSDDGRQVVFIRAGPAGDHLIAVVHREELGATVEASSTLVRVPDHDELPPEPRRYEVVGWRDGILHFRVAGDEWEYDPRSDEALRRDP